MLKLGRKIVKFRIPIFILSLLLLIPSAIGYLNTRVNYDVLYYLPDDIETMKGQDILVDEFGTGAYSMFVCEGMENKDVAALKKKIEKVDHVAKVVWYDSLSDISIPAEMLPEKIKKVLFADDSTMMFIIFDTTTSADETMDCQWYVSNCYRYKKSGRVRGYGLRIDRCCIVLYCSGTYHGILFNPVFISGEYRNCHSL